MPSTHSVVVDGEATKADIEVDDVNNSNAESKKSKAGAIVAGTTFVGLSAGTCLTLDLLGYSASKAVISLFGPKAAAWVASQGVGLTALFSFTVGTVGSLVVLQAGYLAIKVGKSAYRVSKTTNHNRDLKRVKKVTHYRTSRAMSSRKGGGFTNFIKGCKRNRAQKKADKASNTFRLSKK